jgi:glycosyltransferase involved in cell wall biosynthesis
MTAGPLASIIIDNYNYGRYLGAAIDSALAQTYARVEIIVVDDGSADNSRGVIAAYGTRVRAILKDNGGQGSAFNAGFAASRGEIVVFLDADDMLLPTALERAIPRFDCTDVVKVHWPLWMVDEHGRRTGQMCPGPALPEGDLRARAFRLGPTNHLSAPGCGNAWARHFLERALPLPEGLYRNGCDTCLFELAPFFGLLRALAEPQTLYRQHGHNDHSALGIEAKIERELRFYEHYAGVLEEYGRSIGVAVDRETWRRNSWWHRHRAAIDALKALPRPGRPIVLIDDGTWELGPIDERRRLPLVEHDRQDWGPPPDDAAAIAALERQRQGGAAYVVFAWPAFWWLDYYAGLSRHLRSCYACVLNNECVVVFDLSRGPTTG